MHCDALPSPSLRPLALRAVIPMRRMRAALAELRDWKLEMAALVSGLPLAAELGRVLRQQLDVVSINVPPP